MKELEYIKLCEKESSLILQKIILKKQLKRKEQLIKKINKYCKKISNDERAMCGEHLACDDILHIIKKAKDGE